MSKLEQLINELCPDGVEYVELKKICKFQNGFAFKSSLFKNEGLPILRITNINKGRISTIKKNYVFFNPTDYKENLEQYKIRKNDIVIAMSGATTGKVGYNYNNDIYYLNQRVGLFIPNEIFLKKRFLYHWLLSKSKDILNASLGSGAQPNLSSKKMMNFKIPLPPLPVQEEIVRILDEYTSKVEEIKETLQKELTSRKKQYEYYRDELLKFGDEVERVKLGDIAKIERGASPRPIKSFITTNKNGINWIKIGDVKNDAKYITSTKEKITKEGAKKSRYVKKGDFILSNSMSFGRPYILNIDGCIHDGWLSISNFQHIIKDFLYYILISSDIQKQMKQKASFGGAVQNLNSDIVKNLQIPLPPLSEQQRIVDILDRFDTLCNDITNGLPAEIEKRQKQYEYYRDKLLDFKEK